MSKKFKNPKHIIIFLTILSLFLFLLSSCRANVKNVSTEIELDSGETGILAENDAVDFYFYYPENWKLHRNDAMIMIDINDSKILETDKEAPGLGENFAIPVKPNLSAQAFGLIDGMYETVDDYWNNFAAPLLEEIFQNVDRESSEDLTVDGLSAKKYTYTFSSMGMNFKISEVIFFKSRQVYILTYTATEDKYDKYENVLATAAETLKFK